jgi:hypothetical protein
MSPSEFPEVRTRPRCHDDASRLRTHTTPHAISNVFFFLRRNPMPLFVLHPPPLFCLLIGVITLEEAERTERRTGAALRGIRPAAAMADIVEE